MSPVARHKTLKSVCALDCPDTCSILVTIEDGVATRLRGDPTHSVTRGFLCGKVSRYLEREYNSDRLMFPLTRIGRKGEGRFTRIPWEEALDRVAARLKAISVGYGPEAILPYSYGGSMGLLNGAGMDRRFFHRLGASRLDRTICASAGGAALNRSMGFRYGTEPEQFAQSKLIIAWGANILGTNSHLWPFIVEARRKGAKFYTIDPVKNRTGKLADKHFEIHPGSDLALALGIAHVLLAEKLVDEEYVRLHTAGFEDFRKLAGDYPPDRVETLTGIPKADIAELAREYGRTKPAVIRVNYGVQRSERGGAAVHAIAALPALTGSWKLPGGGFVLSTSGAFQLNRAGLEREDLQMQSPLGRPARTINMSQLGRALTEAGQPPIQALVVYNSNPASVVPHQNRVLAGLRREDLFTVVLEQFPTDTTDYADIVLPVTTFLEHTDLYSSYGHYYLQLARPAIDPPASVKSNVEIFRLLAEKMGFQEPCFRDSEDDMIRTLLDSGHPFLKGITLDVLERERAVRLKVSPGGQPFLPFAEGGFGTPSGRFEFGADLLEYVPPVESRLGAEGLQRRYPLELITPKNDDSMNSTFGYRPEVDAQTAILAMHEKDAAPRGIVDGDAVRVFNQRGSCVLKVHVNGSARAGVVVSPSVRWNKKSPGNCNINSLVSDRLTDIGGGAAFYSCLVEVERCAD